MADSINLKGIFAGSLEYIISTYLYENENREEMLKKFKGNKMELANFLRDRNYKEWIKNNKKPADTSEIKNRINKLAEQNKENAKNNAEEKKESIVDKVGLNALQIKEEQAAKAMKTESPSRNRTWNKKKKDKSSDSNQSSLF